MTRKKCVNRVARLFRKAGLAMGPAKRAARILLREGRPLCDGKHIVPGLEPTFRWEEAGCTCCSPGFWTNDGFRGPRGQVSFGDVFDAADGKI